MSAEIDFGELREMSLRLAGKPPFSADNLYVDFLLTLALGGIQQEFGFALKGGTAIVKAWLPPYRFSYDLDFSHFAPGNPRVHYKKYRSPLIAKLGAMGFSVDEEGGDAHRSGGRIYIARLMDKTKYLKRAVKISVSSIDREPVFPIHTRDFRTLADITERKYALLYPQTVPKLLQTRARVLAVEELCAEKIRALATRGTEEGWSLILRDVFDLHVMEQAGILGEVLSCEKGRECVRRKFSAIKGMAYWKKLDGFMHAEPEITILEEERAIFFDGDALSEERAELVLLKVQNALKGILGAELK